MMWWTPTSPKSMTTEKNKNLSHKTAEAQETQRKQYRHSREGGDDAKRKNSAFSAPLRLKIVFNFIWLYPMFGE